MTTKVELNAWSIAKELTKRVITGINKALPILLDELKRLTPEDTREMLSSYQVERAKFDWNSIIWVISNTADHAIYVERWQKGRVFIYQKPKWNKGFYVWEWNRTFARAVDNTREKVIQTIYNEIDR